MRYVKPPEMVIPILVITSTVGCCLFQLISVSFQCQKWLKNQKTFVFLIYFEGFFIAITECCVSQSVSLLSMVCVV